jgi:hypothetical protein
MTDRAREETEQLGFEASLQKSHTHQFNGIPAW